MTTKQAPEVPLRYLEIREAYLRAAARLRNYEEELCALLGAEDAGASLEEKMLVARTEGKHLEAIARLHALGVAADKAADALDTVTELQKRRVAKQQAEFDKDLRQLEC
jgi:hypothetical protein